MKKINSRAKGAGGERELARILRERGHDGARRGQQFCGANGDADVIGLDGFHIECKRVERLNIEEALKQAEDDARAEEVAIVAHRKNREAWKVTIRLDDFLNLIESM